MTCTHDGTCSDGMDGTCCCGGVDMAWKALAAVAQAGGKSRIQILLSETSG